MVRLKNRYLLVNILYPELEKTVPLKSNNVPDIVAINQPTTNALTQHALIKGIRTQISELFGDYGSGAVSESLNVKYLSPATSTFILRVSRAHYRIAWAALSFMKCVPVKNGKNCVFRVVRVSGTIRKAEEEAIRRAKEIIISAKRELGEQSESTLDNILGKSPEGNSSKDVLMVDEGDSEGEDDISSNGGDG